MSPNPSTISRVSGCLAIIAAAAVGACGGAQSTSNAGARNPAHLRQRLRSCSCALSSVEPAPAPTPTTTMTATVPAVDTAKIPTGAVGYSSELLGADHSAARCTPTSARSEPCASSRTWHSTIRSSTPVSPVVHTCTRSSATPAADGNSTAAVDRRQRQLDLPWGHGQPHGVLGPGHHRHAGWDTGQAGEPDHLLQDRISRHRAGSRPADAGRSANDRWRLEGQRAHRVAELRSSTALTPSTGEGPKTVELPTTCPVGNTIWATVTFPQCWDGVHLDSPDHKSHMAYPVDGALPCDHPVPFPEMTLNFSYTVTDAAALAHWRLASDNYDSSIPAGYSLHADWFNGWKPEIMESLHPQLRPGVARLLRAPPRQWPDDARRGRLIRARRRRRAPQERVSAVGRNSECARHDVARPWGAVHSSISRPTSASSLPASTSIG